MAEKRKPKGKPDLATFGGLILALAGLLGGLLLEGGKLTDIAQYTAAVIVLGGTVGAVMINTPLSVLRRAVAGMAGVFFEKSQPAAAIAEELLEYATKARKHGLTSLEQDAELVADPFLQKALMLAVDGTDLQEMRRMLELDIETTEMRADAEAKVFEVAGGYAPTIGIIGAVMGLMQVMKNLSDIDKVGHGIAVSFVATVYGVAVANLFFLPVANKMRARIREASEKKEMILEGTVSIVEGLNPKLIRTKLDAFMNPEPAGKKKKKV
jgi:chemotaxis protein MotA